MSLVDWLNQLPWWIVLFLGLFVGSLLGSPFLIIMRLDQIVKNTAGMQTTLEEIESQLASLDTIIRHPSRDR